MKNHIIFLPKIISNIMEQNFADCCIICLEKKTDTINLVENFEKLNELSLLCHCEFINYTEYSQLICTICNGKLTFSYNFVQQVFKSLQILNSKVKNERNESITDEATSIQDDVPKCSDEDPLHAALETANVTRKLRADSIKLVPLDEANKVIEEFKIIMNASKDCVCCDFSGTSRRSLSAHMLSTHREKRNIWCRDCNGIFENIAEHKKIHDSKHSCPFCGNKKNSSRFVEHILSHTGKFECKICEKKFNSESWLRKHILIHSEDRPHRCPNCSKGFIQTSSLKYHLTTHGNYGCRVCKKHFKTEGENESHECVISDRNDMDTKFESIIIKCEILPNSENDKRDKFIVVEDYEPPVAVKKPPDINYSLPKEFECQICQKKFINGYRFRLHVRKHKGALPYKCTSCHKNFSDRTEFNNHKRVHTKEKPFKCSICEKMFSQKSTLTTHMKRHTGRPEVCEICGKRFCRKTELKMHLSKHKGEKPFLCMKCGKVFAQISHLTEHMLGHGEERPHKCSFCEKAFKKNSVLKSHLRLHMDQKPFKCEYCSYSCYTAYRLQQHTAKLHDRLQIKNNSQEVEKVSDTAEKIKIMSNKIQLLI
ncbi:uncharacterized protein isoform X1 [Leptinotarsa decemlineata]|uniref:uncharacterized protein isoform X1 n=1 Tax=Leptinotarsa decemlineata TaxID=7539 RepID=UPI003D306EF3